jgi:hypothetical protein
MRRRDITAAAAGALVTAVLAGGVAWAAIPGPDGVIHGCYNASGNLKVVETLPCPTGYTPLAWNEKGEPGDPGPPGPDGADGVSPTVAQLSQGDANCPAGGAAITDASGSTAFVCSGQDGADGDPFSGTFTSPNGQYSLTVADSGLTLANGANTRILIQNGTIDTRALANLSLRGDTQVNITGALRVDVDAPVIDVQATGGATIRAVAGLDLLGGLVKVGGGGCLPAARSGDLVIVDPDSGVGNIALGSPTVCIG